MATVFGGSLGDTAEGIAVDGAGNVYGRWVITGVDEKRTNFVALIDRVPRPIRERARIAYLTNVYTRPDSRGQGIGAQIIRRAQEAAREADVEVMIVWPLGLWSKENSEGRSRILSK